MSIGRRASIESKLSWGQELKRRAHAFEACDLLRPYGTECVSLQAHHGERGPLPAVSVFCLHLGAVGGAGPDPADVAWLGTSPLRDACFLQTRACWLSGVAGAQRPYDSRIKSIFSHGINSSQWASREQKAGHRAILELSFFSETKF